MLKEKSGCLCENCGLSCNNCRCGGISYVEVCNSSIVIGGVDTSITNGASCREQERGEMEGELIRIFRALPMRERVRLLENTYAFNDSFKKTETKKAPAR